MEASALPASVGLARARLGLGVPLLRLRSDEQLVSLLRAGNEDAFRVIHDRYRARMLAYARQMLASTPTDAEDIVQEIFVRAYAGLRANRRDLALRAWLYRIAHNRCIDELRRPQAVAVEVIEELGAASGTDPHARVEQREALRRLIADVQRLPEQQRSALLMRELGGMPYADLSGALGVSVPAVKSLLVRARVGLAQAGEARDTACSSIREDLIVAHDRGVRASGRARRHMRDCPHCRQFRTEVHGMSRRFALLLPALGPLAVAAKLGGLTFGGLGGGGGAAAGSGTGAAAGSTAAAAGTTAAAGSATTAAAGATAVAGTAAGGTAAAGSAAAVAGGTAAGTAAVSGTGAAVAGTSVAAGGGALAAAGAGHVATIIAATVVAAGGAIGIQHEVSTGSTSPAAIHSTVRTPAVAAAASPASAGTTPRAQVAAGRSLGTLAATAPAVNAVARTAATGASPTSTALRRVTYSRMNHAGAPPEASFHAPPTGFPSQTQTTTTGSTATAGTTGAPGTTTGPTTGTTGPTTGTTEPTTIPVTDTDPTTTTPVTDPAPTSSDPTSVTTQPSATTPSASPSTTSPLSPTIKTGPAANGGAALVPASKPKDGRVSVRVRGWSHAPQRHSASLRVTSRLG